MTADRWKRELRAAFIFVVPVALVACDRFKPKKPLEQPEPVPPVVVTSAAPVPPAMPLSDVDAAVIDLEGKTPLEQSKAYYAAGQNWMARLVIEQRALSASATKDETLHLAQICHDQGDKTCLDNCSKKLGKKLSFDGGVPKTGDAGAGGAIEHQEPDTDLAKARDLLLKTQLVKARAILEPKVLSDKASPEEIKMLRMVCEKQNDKMCVALCASKLK